MEEKFREIFEKSPIGIIFLDKEGKITDANQSALKIGGFSSLNEVIGINIFNAVDMDSKKDELLKNGHIKIQSPLDFNNIKKLGIYNTTRSGTAFIDLTISVIDSGFLVQIQDITERKKAEEQYQTLFNSIDEGFCIIELIFNENNKPIDYRFLQVNPAFERQTGLHEAEGKLMRELRPNHEEHWFEIYGKIALTGKPIRFQNPAKELNRFYDVYAFKIGSPKSRKVAILFNDISERKKAEESLRKESEFNAGVLETARAVIIIQDKEGKIIGFNPYAQEISGYSFEEVKNRKVWDFLLIPEEFEAVKKAWGELKADMSLDYFENYWKGKDGNLIHLAWSSTVISDSKGNPEYIIGIAMDITDRKKLEDELRQSRDNLEKQVKERTQELELASAYNRSLIEASLDPLVTIGPDGKITDVNSSTEAVTGYSRDEIIDTDFCTYFTEPKKAREGYKQVFNEGSVRDYPLKIKHKNGQLTPVLYNASIYKDKSEEIMGVFAAARDITEQKKADKIIKTEKQRLNNLMEIIPAYLILLNPEYHVTFANRFFRERFGESGGQRCFEYLFGLTEPCENCESYKVLKTGVPHQWEWNGPDGRYYDIYDFPFKETDGSPLIMEFGIDITKRKKAEEKLKETIKELEHSNKELQQFAYVSSHDLQEPLRTIASFTQLLKKRYEGKFDSDADEFMDYIVEAAIRMKTQIEGLLEYSRVGTKGKEFELVDLNKVLNQTLENLHISIKESKAKIIVDELPELMGDARQLQRVFQNLISNAIKFRKCEETLIIHISSNKDLYNKEYLFSIKDNGIGIEEQYSERIFTIFQRLHTREVYKGTGIGLSIVKRIIERHNGRIWVESSFGVGSTFYFTIPIVKG